MNLEEFKLPIYYQKKSNKLNSIVINDLELIKSENNKGIYEHIFSPKTIFSENIMKHWADRYSFSEKFLKDQKYLILNIKNYSIPLDICFNEINSIYNEINDNKNFNNQYSFINIDFLKQVNQNETILQASSLYNICSPVFSLLTPFILLLVPFFLIKIQNYPITLENYIEFLKKSFGKHPLGGLFSDFNSIKVEKKIYIGCTIIFYIYQIYQNVISCINYFKNLNKIHDYLFKIKKYLEFTTQKMDEFYKISKDLKCFKKFNNILLEHTDFLKIFKNKLQNISPYTFSFNKIKELGYLLKIFYNLKNDRLYLKSLNYSFNFNGYLENISQLKINIDNDIMNFASYSNTCEFKDVYYPPLKNENPIKNSFKLDKNMIITGPNAAGKTTILKTAAINIILNQQLSCGCFKQAKLKLYEFIHSYINIPDTSGRDSLFQAEARRCKEIIDVINKNSKSKCHLCIFDELYSGTNPYEAITSAISLLEYLDSFKNINFILTTHYIDICEKLDNKSNIKNFKMNVKFNENNNFSYTYKLEKGISYIKGGTKVLKELNYPKIIVSSVKNKLEKKIKI